MLADNHTSTIDTTKMTKKSNIEIVNQFDNVNKEFIKQIESLRVEISDKLTPSFHYKLTPLS